MSTAVVLGLLILLALRVPVAFAILIPCLGFVMLDDALTVGIVLQQVAGTLNSFPLLAVPLFILVGFVAHEADMADRLVKALLAVFGRVRASLGYVNVAGCLTFSWMSGSATADAAAMGSVMVPTMRRNGYRADFATGLTGAASMIGPMMPPSVGAILFAVLAGVSVGDMFLAGVLPALVIALGLAALVYLHSRRHAGLTSEPLARGEAARTVGAALPVLATPAIILGGILGGVFTPTEAAGVAATYLILLGLVTGWLSPAGLYRALAETAVTTGRVMLIASAGGVLAYVLAVEGTADVVADALRSITDSPWLFLLLLNIVLLLAGTFLEPASALLISVPVVLPIALEFGIDPVQLGTLMILNLSIGLLTPPVGMVLYVLSAVGDVPVAEVVRGTLPTLIPLGATLLVISYVPAVTLLLPGLVH